MESDRPVPDFTAEECSKPSNPKVFLDVKIGDIDVGRLTIELFSEIVPRTCDNFKALCVGTGNLTYKNCTFHRIIPNFMIQGGDFENGNGTGGRSIFGPKFEDENFKISHSSPGVLAMANSGPHTNGSQFFITTAKTPWLDGKHVVFGRLMEGSETLKKMESVGAEDGEPSSPVTIVDCGELQV